MSNYIISNSYIIMLSRFIYMSVKSQQPVSIYATIMVNKSKVFNQKHFRYEIVSSS